jgi:hypothetical protein
MSSVPSVKQSGKRCRQQSYGKKRRPASSGLSHTRLFGFYLQHFSHGKTCIYGVTLIVGFGGAVDANSRLQAPKFPVFLIVFVLLTFMLASGCFACALVFKLFPRIDKRPQGRFAYY